MIDLQKIAKKRIAERISSFVLLHCSKVPYTQKIFHLAD